MNICLLGSTGRVGSEILKKSLKHHCHVTAIVRTPNKLMMKSEYLTVVEGDVLNEEDLVDAMEGADVVISALGTDNCHTLSKSMPLIIKAMYHYKIRRIVTIGTARILNSRKKPDLYRFQSNERKRKSTIAAADHLMAYQDLSKSDLKWTIICPTYLPDGIEKGEYRIALNTLPIDGKEITVGDTAAFVFKSLFNEAYVHVRVGISY